MVSPPVRSCGQGNQVTDTCVQPDTVIEPSIAVNPADPLNAVAVFQAGRIAPAGDADNGWATTKDGGQTWTYGTLGLTTFTGGVYARASDAVVAFGPDNYVYANSLVLAEGQSTAGLTVNVSSDGGTTWGRPVTILYDGVGGNDKNWIVVDNGNGAGHHRGRVYVVWDRIAPVVAAYSDDHGSTWNTCGGLGCVIYAGQGLGSLPFVAPNGDLNVIFTTLAHPLPPAVLAGNVEFEDIAQVDKIVMSTAFGAGTVPTGGPLVFGPPITVAGVDSPAVRGQRAGDGIPTAAADPRTGKLFVAWNSGRFRKDKVSDIILTSSSNGIDWSPAVRVNGGAKDDYLNRWCPMLAVGDDGKVRVAYRQRQEESFSFAGFYTTDVDTMYQESVDGGRTFGAPLQVDQVTSNMHFGAVSRGGVFLGDYDQMATAGGHTYIARSEPIQTDPAEVSFFLPTYHHQRLYVAVVQS